LPQNFAPGAAGVWHFGQTAAAPGAKFCGNCGQGLG